nr:zf-CCHC domain-containing protein/DUF4219 domain-containing protein/UBN2 domain-containing protein [Tanacetum cinerariifolium]
MVAEDDETSKDKEIDKLMALISLSFKKIYKPTNNNLQTSSNTSRANQDNSPRINRSTGYENQMIGNFARARETIGSTVVQKSEIQCYNCKEFGHVARERQKPKRVKDAAYHRENMLLCKQKEAGIQLNAKQADWRDDTDDELEDQELEAHYIEQIYQNDDDNDLANELEKLKGEIEDFKNKNISLESSNSRFKEANNKLSETNMLLYNDFKKSQAELERRNNVEYASKVEIDCAKARGDLISYKMESQKSFNKYIQTINDLNQTISKMKNKLSAHQETISILSQQKEAQFKLYKTHEDKELDEVIALENKVKILDNIVYKTVQSVQTINMLNNKCRMSFAKAEFLKKAQRANPQKRMDESISWDQKCKSSLELFKIKSSVGTIFDGVERCKETIAKRTYIGHIDPFIQNTIEANFSSEIQKINVDWEKFHVCLKEEMVADLRYFNSLKIKVDSLKSQLETQKTQFLNEIDRLSREYFYADHMNAILGVYTELDEVMNLQCDYIKLLQKCKCLEKELSKSKMMSKSFKELQKHVVNLELDLQQCKEKIKNDKYFKVNKSKEFCKEREQYFEIRLESSVTRQRHCNKPQLKRNPMEVRVMLNNSKGKKQEVEDQRRNLKLSMNKMSVTLVEIVLFIIESGCSKGALQFETYVKADSDLWHIILNGDFPSVGKNKVIQVLKVVPFEQQNDDLKSKLAKNNEDEIVLYNALPKKECERIFMCKIAKDI